MKDLIFGLETFALAWALSIYGVPIWLAAIVACAILVVLTRDETSSD